MRKTKNENEKPKTKNEKVKKRKTQKKNEKPKTSKKVKTVNGKARNKNGAGVVGGGQQSVRGACAARHSVVFGRRERARGACGV
jgi:hypothetical protein